MASNDELACSYAALALADDGVAVTAEKITALLKAAKVNVEAYWPGLFAKALEGCDIKEMCSNVGSGAGGGGAAAPAAGGAAGGDAPAAEAKKEEKKEESEESDDDMGFGLFD